MNTVINQPGVISCEPVILKNISGEILGKTYSSFTKNMDSSLQNGLYVAEDFEIFELNDVLFLNKTVHFHLSVALVAILHFFGRDCLSYAEMLLRCCLRYNGTWYGF